MVCVIIFGFLDKVDFEFIFIGDFLLVFLVLFLIWIIVRSLMIIFKFLCYIFEFFGGKK